MLMSSLSSDDVLRIAKLARLKLSKKEVDSLKTELSSVINYFTELTELRTDNIEPTSQTTGLKDVLRADEIDEPRMLSADSATSGTEKVHNNYFVVPQVIDKDQ
jgi:aspartyl-tRNA(Asn)/glutamyl-tRNA(Gln) amidotransferase subunit C